MDFASTREQLVRAGLQGFARLREAGLEKILLGALAIDLVALGVFAALVLHQPSAPVATHRAANAKLRSAAAQHHVPQSRRSAPASYPANLPVTGAP